MNQQENKKRKNRPFLRFLHNKLIGKQQQEQQDEQQQNHETAKKNDNKTNKKKKKRNGQRKGPFIPSNSTGTEESYSSSYDKPESTKHLKDSFFSDDVDENDVNIVIHPVMALNEFTEDEKKSYWYTNEDIKQIRTFATKEAIEIMELEESNNNNKSNKTDEGSATMTTVTETTTTTTANKETTEAKSKMKTTTRIGREYLLLRGLEAVSPSRQKRRLENRHRVSHAVFQEQFSQRIENGGGFYSELLHKELAEVAIIASKKSIRHAKKIAKHDQISAIES